MGMGDVISLMREGILQVITLVSPALVAALIIGLIVSIFKSTTSIQEQTLTFLPKLLVIIGVLALLGGWMFSELGEYTINLFNKIPDIAK